MNLPSTRDTVFSDCPSLVDLLRHRALNEPERNVFTTLDAAGNVTGRISFGELDRRARAIAAELQARGLEGERALLLFPTGLRFVAALFGCLYARVTAIPAPRPQASRLARTLPRFRSMIADARPAVIFTDFERDALAGELGPELLHIPWLSVEACLGNPVDAWRKPVVGRDHIAHLQYTSGSTAQPKGTQITHGNVLANSRDMQVGKRYSRDATSLVWVPHYHDDGLVQGIFQPIYSGYHAILMSPMDFAARPASWLEAITRHRVTHSGGPNFAFELCIRRVSDAEYEQLDLRSWSMAYCAAEPVRPQTLTRFAERFGPRGFRWRSFAPSYGMAETTLVVSTDGVERGPRFLACDPAALEQARRVVPLPANEPGARVLVACGRPVGDTQVAIVDPASCRALRGDEVGEIWVKGPGVAAGYAGLPEETQKTFRARLADSGEGPFLRTGDLGFLEQGEVFITGRLKDLIIVRGENRYPQDIEATVESVDAGIRAGCSAAFSIERDLEEKLVIVAEVTPRRAEQDPAAQARWQAEVIDGIRQRVAAAHGVEVDAVALLRTGGLRKTSSGKVQRQAARAEFLDGSADELFRWSRTTSAAPAPTIAPAAATRSAQEIEAFLAAEVAERLGVPVQSIDRSAPFTRFGLDSMNSVAVVAALARWLCTTLPDDLLGDRLSIRDAAQRVSGVTSGGAQRSAPAQPPEPVVARAAIVELRPCLVRQPLFCVGGVTGMVKNLWPLACFLGDDRPFFGLHTPGLDGAEPPRNRVASIATRMLDELRAVQPKGPYLLGGHSFGGYVAHEMAHQLEQQGEAITAVLLLDTTLPERGQAPLVLSPEDHVYELVNLFAQVLGGEPSSAALDRLQAMSPAERLQLLQEQLQASKLQLSGARVPQLVALFGASLEATAHYQPTASSFPVKLFRAQLRGRYLVERSHVSTSLEMTRGLGWERVCSSLEIIDVPGGHLSLLQQPHVRTLAQALKQVLAGCSAQVKLHAAPVLTATFPYA